MSDSNDSPALLSQIAEAARPEVKARWPEWQKRLAELESHVVTVQDSHGARPRRLRLLSLATDRAVDATYQQEWLELAIADDGCLYLVTCYKQDLDIATQWSPGITLPQTLWSVMPDWLMEIVAAPKSIE